MSQTQRTSGMPTEHHYLSPLPTSLHSAKWPGTGNPPSPCLDSSLPLSQRDRPNVGRVVVLKREQSTHLEGGCSGGWGGLLKHRLPGPIPRCVPSQGGFSGCRVVSISPGNADAAGGGDGVTHSSRSFDSLCLSGRGGEGSSLPELKLFFSIQNGLGEATSRTGTKVMLPHQATWGCMFMLKRLVWCACCMTASFL